MSPVPIETGNDVGKRKVRRGLRRLLVVLGAIAVLIAGGLYGVSVYFLNQGVIR